MVALSERPVAIVTGGSGGIGAACALHLAQAGLSIAVNYAGNEAGAGVLEHGLSTDGGKLRSQSSLARFTLHPRGPGLSRPVPLES